MRALMPWTGVTGLRTEMDRLFERFLEPAWNELSTLGDWQPKVDITETKDTVVVKAELPGMKKEDLDLNISENLLTIKGEKKKEEEVKEKGYYYSERSYGSFTRTVELPKEVQTDKVRASFKDGVLEIRVPKTEEAKRKEVKIKVE